MQRLEYKINQIHENIKESKKDNSTAKTIILWKA